MFISSKGDENVYQIDRGPAYTFYGEETRVTDFEIYFLKITFSVSDTTVFLTTF